MLSCHGHQGPVPEKIVSLLVILSKERTMVAGVISKLKVISRLQIFLRNWPSVDTVSAPGIH